MQRQYPFLFLNGPWQPTEPENPNFTPPPEYTLDSKTLLKITLRELTKETLLMTTGDCNRLIRALGWGPGRNPLTGTARRVVDFKIPKPNHHQPITGAHLSILIPATGISYTALQAQLTPVILASGPWQLWDQEHFFATLNSYAWKSGEDGLLRPVEGREEEVRAWERWFGEFMAEGKEEEEGEGEEKQKSVVLSF